MREAVGGTLLFYIILGFLAVFIIFIGIIMNYAATYRASNYVITYLEQNEGEPAARASDLCEDLRKRHYYNTLSISCDDANTNGTGAVYTVETNIKFQIPLINYGANLYINNETKTLYGVGCVIQEPVSINCGG